MSAPGSVPGSVPGKAASYPVRVSGRLDEPLSRWLWLVKWLLALPHAIVLAFLWIAFLLVSLVAMVAIVLNGRYPRALFDFNLGVVRWTWRVSFYAYGGLATDRYPPFTLKDVPDYPARLEVPYPETLSRGLALVKWWLLALPQYLVVAALSGSGWGTGNVTSIGLVGVLCLVAGGFLLFTERYPRELFDLVLGLDRWVIRVVAYAGLLTDAYPPFRLDQGDEELRNGG
jgi:hypothetical protein